MCTAICCDMGQCYFGRNLDLEYNYSETVTVTPQNFTFEFGNGDVMKSHYAMIGIEYVADGYPLYYDAVNEKGVAMAGLSFDGFAHYNKPCVEKNNIASYEIIPYILCCCGDMCQVIDIVNDLNIFAEREDVLYPVRIRIRGIDRYHLLSDLIYCITEQLHLSMSSIATETVDHIGVCTIDFAIHSLNQLEKAIASIASIDGVDEVSRIDIE